MSSFEFDYNNLITVLVGKDEERFTVHKDNICEKSKFFEAALSGENWLEAKEKLVRLPDVDPQAFQAYAHWCYTNKVVLEVCYQSTAVTEREQKFAYTELYILADVLDDAELRKHVLELLIDGIGVWHNQLHISAVHGIWERTPKGSPLRTLVLEWKMGHGAGPSFCEHVAQYPKEFLEEMAAAFMSRRRPGIVATKELKAEIRAKVLTV